jgi:hypothetical protein
MSRSLNPLALATPDKECRVIGTVKSKTGSDRLTLQLLASTMDVQLLPSAVQSSSTSVTAPVTHVMIGNCIEVAGKLVQQVFVAHSMHVFETSSFDAGLYSKVMTRVLQEPLLSAGNQTPLSTIDTANAGAVFLGASDCPASSIS